jgi:hypothetical protein
LKFGIDMLLNSAKHTAVAALELDGGAAATQIWSQDRRQPADQVSSRRAARWLGSLGQLHSVSETTAALEAAGRVTELHGGYFPLTSADIAELAKQVCVLYPSLQPRIPDCDERAPEHGDATAPPFGMAVPIGGEMLASAPMIQLPALPPTQPPDGSVPALRTHQLWPTLVSTLGLPDEGGFLDRLSAAARAAYATFLGTDAACGHQGNTANDIVCDDNDEFFGWQGGQRATGQRLPLDPADLSRLKELATRACFKHLQAHRRPGITMQDLGWPKAPRFQLWAAVLGGHSEQTQSGAQGGLGGHGEHAHANSICSGALYSAVPRSSSNDNSSVVAPIVFSDPRGSWSLSREGGPWRPTMLFSGSSPGQP